MFARLHILSLLCVFCLYTSVQAQRTDTIIIRGKVPGAQSSDDAAQTPKAPRPTTSATNGADIKRKITQAVQPFDSSRIVKKKPPVIPKNAARSAQDPDALSYGAFKVSPDLYGEHARTIMDYVINYHKNFGTRLSRIKSGNKGYFSFIDNTMRKYNVPKEMHSLAVIESALNPNAVSPAGATGPWQFMEGTAEMFGLRVDEELDERRDFYKSTHAAAKYVKRLHNIFHDWLLVVAAYNCGPAPVLRHLSKTGSKSFWDIKHLLPKETQNHVMAFIAVCVFYDRNSKVLDLGNLPKEGAKAKRPTTAPIASSKKTKTTKAPAPQTKPAPKEEDLDEIGDVAVADDPNGPEFTQEELSQVLTLKVKGAYNLECISEVIDCDIKKLRRWNPQFNEKAYANAGPVSLTIPAKSIDVFLLKKQEILSASLKNPRPTSGETVHLDPRQRAKTPNYSNVAHSNATSANTSESLQHITPKTKSSQAVDASAAAKPTEKPAEKKPKTYTVKNGDNLTEIAEQFGLTVARLMELNKLTKPVIQPGNKLFLE